MSREKIIKGETIENGGEWAQERWEYLVINVSGKRERSYKSLEEGGGYRD